MILPINFRRQARVRAIGRKNVRISTSSERLRAVAVNAATKADEIEELSSERLRQLNRRLAA